MDLVLDVDKCLDWIPIELLLIPTISLADREANDS